MSQIKGSQTVWLKLFHICSAVNSAISRILESLHSAIFMGLIDNQVFQKFDVYPYGDWEGAFEVSEDGGDPVADWLTECAARDLSIGDRILVVGAGGGKELLHLARAGFQVRGVDFDERLVERTQTLLNTAEGGQSVSLDLAGRFEIPGEESSYDAIFLPRYFFSYIHGREERVRFLTEAGKKLKSGGIVGVDYFLRMEERGSSGALAFTLQVPITNFLRMIRGRGSERIEEGDHLDPSVPLFHHHFVGEEIASEFAAANFSIKEQGQTWSGWTVAKSKSH